MHIFHLSFIRGRLDGHTNLKHVTILLVGRRREGVGGAGGWRGARSGTKNVIGYVVENWKELP